MAAPRCLPLAGPQAVHLLASVDTLLFDCDGVIWRGEQAVPGASEVLAALRRAGKRVFFLTNNSTKTRAMYAAKLRRLGLGSAESEVFGTAYCTALYLRKVAQLQGKVYLIGGQALSQELQEAGIAHLGPGPDPVLGGTSDWAAAALDPDVRAVVVGFDEHFSYMKLTKALGYLQDPTCLFLATNTDTRLPLEGGKAIPGTGCLVRAVETAAHRQAEVIGKPSRFLYECLASENNVNPARTVMVGDRLDTDILMGFSCGLKTVLTLTGFSSLEEAKSHESSDCPAKRSMVPDYYVESIADLLPALQA
ncbi:glycerol-3-phosphate phosphatase [Rhinatrema bivittatum]|uniref:glycerol-3-phosphate phosphatase n=1 Tax=Rhinatrema bivittatum TaxID=194408 RepID=UPI001126E24D|nr:glycerol-3-phosphate phosphatase [Rhinatrema bivittatum]